MGVSSSESHDLTAFYELLTASFGVLSQNTGFYPSLDRIVETTLGPLNLGPGGRSYNEPISCLHRFSSAYECQDGVKGASSTTALAHQFPPPSSSGRLLWPNRRDTGMRDWLSQSLFLDWGNCSSGPQRLIYICT